MIVKFSRIAARVSFISTIFFGFYAQAGAVEVALAANEKVVISISEANLMVSSSRQAKAVRVEFSEGTDGDYVIEKKEGFVEIRSRDQLSRTDFGKLPKKKRDVEVVLPISASVDIHLLEGVATISKISRDLLAHVYKGRILVKDCQGTNLTLHIQKGDLAVSDSQGRLLIDSYAAAVTVRNYSGDIELQNFLGESILDKLKGFISLNVGAGTAKILASSGSVQFELGKGILSSNLFQGRIEGQSGEGSVNVTLAPESDLNVKSQAGKVSVQTPVNSGALLNISTQEGEIYGPNYLKVSRDGGVKSLRGRLKGDTQKSSVVIRGQETAIIIK